GGGNPWALGGDNGPHALTLARDGSGQFHLSARVNGRPAQFLVDTGADTVAITQDQAQALGLRVDPADYVVPVHSASGSAMAARVPLSQIEIGGRTMSDVEALVVPGLRQNLLGQSALRRLGRVELSGDTMVLDPR
ncbi:MAG TPA: TIGR02281 family clan AA aspartic protease, partial [Novosphingobium sp.]|nr:TIGR02281 family clan AA aspartic protease [Novosphingobium sp.]